MTPATVWVVPKGEGGGLMFCSLWTWRGLPAVIPLHLTREGWDVAWDAARRRTAAPPPACCAERTGWEWALGGFFSRIYEGDHGARVSELAQALRTGKRPSTAFAGATCMDSCRLTGRRQLATPKELND